MKELTIKQQERNAKKKKKLAALANLVQMNDKDRMDAKNATKMQEEEELEQLKQHQPMEFGCLIAKATETNDEAAGFSKVTTRKKSKKNVKSSSTSKTKAANEESSLEYEPTSKRLKSTNNNYINDDDGNTSDISLPSKELDELKAMQLTLSDEQYRDLCRQLRERKRELINVPIIRLRESGRRAQLDWPDDKRTPIFLTDIQHLLMTALIGKKSPCTPERWCHIEKPLKLAHSVVLVLDGFSLYHYLSNETKFENTNKIFDTRLEVILPPNKDGIIIDEIAQVPLTNAQAHKLVEEHGSLESAVEMLKDPTLIVKAIFPIETEIENETENEIEMTTQTTTATTTTSETSTTTSTEISSKDLHPEDKFPRTKLLLSALQMVDEGYPMPLRGELHNRFKNYIFTKDKYMPVTNQSPMFGVDCEMCTTSAGFNELTRISIVNEKFETVYESLVMPSNKITDYLTPFSGITAELMEKVTKKLTQVQKEVKELLPSDAILVGQSLNADLNAMRMMHPYVIDTSVCFNLTGQRKRKSKLRTLAMTFLKEVIQKFKDGHDSVEDSKAALKLVKMKLANSVEFGDEILMQKKRFHEITRMAQGDNIKNNLFAHVSQRDKRTAIVTNGPLQKKTKELFRKADEALPSNGDNSKTVSIFEMESNKKALKKAREIILENSLTIVNLKLYMDQSKLDIIEKTVENLDKWIKKLWSSIAHNGLLLVLMGGSSECPSGVLKIAIKKDVADVAAATPIGV